MKKLLFIGFLAFASTAVYPFASWMSNPSVNNPAAPAINVSQHRQVAMDQARIKADLVKLRHEYRVQNALPGLGFATLSMYLAGGAMNAALRIPQVDAALAVAAGLYTMPHMYYGHLQRQQIRSLEDSLVEPVA